MTNVPQEIRDAWADVYRLFDVSYNMDGSEEAWKTFWERANELIRKYDDDIPLLELLESIAHMIEIFINQRKTENQCLRWDKREGYPHPKKLPNKV